MINWTLGVYQIKDLKANDKNPRQISKDQFNQLQVSIEKFGFIDRPIINKNLQIICGHQRIKVLKRQKAKTVECWVPDRLLDESEVDELMVRHNLNTGSFDFDILANEFDALELLDWGFTESQLMGISKEDLENDILSDDEERELLEPCKDEDAITKPGDLYEFGNHRLFCGSSLDKECIEILIKNKKIDMVYTDPPYGIDEETDRDFSSRSRKCKGNKFNKIIGDSNTSTAIESYKICENLNIKVMIWWGANYYCHSLPEIGNWIVWDKRVEENQKDMNSDCELAWVKSNTNSVRIFRHLWKGMIKGSENGEKRIHPTQKPIELAVWCLKNYGKEAKNVLDLFGGSGSSLIACEKEKKNCFMMEMSSAYCDAIVKRYINFLAKKGINATVKRNGELISNDDFI